ncbi:helix-turn-helix domain-containing protein [Eggerthellaceae bacterium zg-886]|uniref:Helix-turn-helix domain-containing protein n=1 Tax=Xiamenia xianingshaonis TaxID=2682776 RepID=A0ABX0IH10_9ACTN|nr:helix-turn-helix domain-containing protein [Xiamenia xianingshaonis]
MRGSGRRTASTCCRSPRSPHDSSELHLRIWLETVWAFSDRRGMLKKGRLNSRKRVPVFQSFAKPQARADFTDAWNRPGSGRDRTGGGAEPAASSSHAPKAFASGRSRPDSPKSQDCMDSTGAPQRRALLFPAVWKPERKGAPMEGARKGRRPLAYDDRVAIEHGLNRGGRMSWIARSIGRTRHVVAEEVKRNWTDDPRGRLAIQNRNICVKYAGCEVRRLCKTMCMAPCRKCRDWLCNSLCPDFEARPCPRRCATGPGASPQTAGSRRRCREPRWRGGAGPTSRCWMRPTATTPSRWTPSWGASASTGSGRRGNRARRRARREKSSLAAFRFLQKGPRPGIPWNGPRLHNPAPARYGLKECR